MNISSLTSIEYISQKDKRLLSSLFYLVAHFRNVETINSSILWLLGLRAKPKSSSNNSWNHETSALVLESFVLSSLILSFFSLVFITFMLSLK